MTALIILISTIGIFSSVSAIKLTHKEDTSSTQNGSNGDGVIDRWAVIVGTDRYAFCDNDAEELYSTLITEGYGWDESHIQKRVRGDASKENIIDDIIWMRENADADDIVLFYFSGHGGRRVIADYWGEPLFLVELKWEFQRAKSYFQRETKQVFIFDTCHAGSWRDDEEKVEAAYENASRYGLKLKYFDYDDENDDGGGDKEIDEKGIFGLSGPNRIVIASCRGYEFSYGDRNLGGGNGIFSYYLIEGLATKDVDTKKHGKIDGWISAEEVFDYSEPATKVHTKIFLWICQQHPENNDQIFGQATLTKAGKSISRHIIMEKMLSLNPMLLQALRKINICNKN
jgi:hypothetical protein